jgi:hypothetical protein
MKPLIALALLLCAGAALAQDPYPLPPKSWPAPGKDAWAWEPRAGGAATPTSCG